MNKFIAICIYAGLLGTSFQVQATTDAEMQVLLQQALMSITGSTGNTSSTIPSFTTPTTAPITTTNTPQKQTISVEPLNYSLTNTKTVDRIVKLNDIVDINLRTYATAKTPIELYLLTFTEDGTPGKKIFIKNVYNEKPGSMKRYRLQINQDILNKAGTAFYVQVGYCVGGCKVAKSKMIKGRIILPRILPTSSDN